MNSNTDDYGAKFPPVGEYSHRSRSSVIYVTILIAFTGVLIAIPLIKIDVSIVSPAVIRPASEMSSIRSLESGRIKVSRVKENQSVKKGDVLLIIDSEALNEKTKYLSGIERDLDANITDLRNIINSVEKFSTPLYRQSYFNYKQMVSELTTRLLKVQTDYNRNLRLHAEKVISDAEFENYQFELRKAKDELESLKQSHLSEWQSQLRNHEIDLLENKNEIALLKKQNENLTIRSPLTGNIQSLNGIYPGSVVFANQELAQISPDTSLVVEAYINPNDIGLIRVNMNARFQVNAFNYNEWGLASGKVIEISSDVHIINDRPIFKVKCALEKEYLQLGNGYKGFLKKGMSLQARFLITKRSVWQLLYDKADDWLNPNAIP